MVFGFKFVGGTMYLEYQYFKLASQILGFISFSETKQCSFFCTVLVVQDPFFVSKQDGLYVGQRL